MLYNEKLYQSYLEELQSLENFKAAHAEHYGHIFQELAEDPYTKHLIDSLAFFTARNRLQGQQKVIHLYERIFRQYFPFLTNPLPAMGMIQCLPSKDLSEKIHCQEGSELCLTTSDGKRVYFQTLGPLDILPIQPYKAHFSHSGSQFHLQFYSATPQSHRLEMLKLYINLLNHFPSSLSLAFALHRHLKKIEISYDSGIPRECSFSIEPFHPGKGHPIENLRLLLHLPEQELFLHLKIPPHAGKWRTFTLTFFLRDEWPKSLQLTKDTFVPFVVPMINLRKRAAEPIRCDGTKDFYSIFYPDPEDQFSLQSVLGVYSIQNHKMVPIKSGIISQQQNTYEIEGSRLLLNFSDSFQTPRLISVEGLWYQPWFSDGFSHEIEQDQKLTLVNQAFKGADLRILGRISPSENQSVSYDVTALTHLLALKNHAELDLDEIIFLMNALKKNQHSYFKEIPSLIREVKIRYLPSGAQQYNIYLEKFDEKTRDLALLFFKTLRNLLDLWMQNTTVELALHSAHFKEPLTIKEGTPHETSTLVRNHFIL